MHYREMSYREMSAWIMGFALLIGMIFYFGLIVSVSLKIGEVVAPIMPSIIFFTLILLTTAIVGHIFAAIYVRKEALASRDERDRRIAARAGVLSGYVFASGIILSLASYLYYFDGNLLFYGVVASLIISQLVEYVLRIFLYRSRI